MHHNTSVLSGLGWSPFDLIRLVAASQHPDSLDVKMSTAVG